MLSMLRLLLLFLMTVFAGQSWGLAVTPHVNYQYDVNNVVLTKQNYSYDNTRNLQYYGVETIVGYQEEKIQAGSFFAFVDGFFVTKGGSLWSSTKSKSAVENALGHWNKHKSEFPELQNAKQYAEGAKNFLTNPPKGTLTKPNSRGDTLRYDPSTNTFGVLGKDGAPRTMFRPKDGMDYWNRQ